MRMKKMQTMTINEIKNAIKGKVYNRTQEDPVTGISTDSRSISEGDLYIPIRGEKFDGHDFIKQAMQNGAIASLTEREEDIEEYKNIILVKNTLGAFHDLALHYKQKFNIPFIAVTGSSGKTTTKDILTAVLKQRFKVLKTQGNYNNEIGLPLTLFQLENHHEIAVVEMGMNHRGEINRLVNMVFPDIAIITNIGVTHIENLGSKDEIFAAKKEIMMTLKKQQLALLNGDDLYLKTIKGQDFQVDFVGIEGKNLNLKAKNIVRKENGVEFSVEARDGQTEKFYLSLPGVHNVYNALFAIYIGRYYGLNNQEIQAGFNAFKPSEMRMNIFQKGKIRIINDVYNANPDSMEAALNTLKDSGENKRTIAVLGDMLEMGEWAEKAHFNIGKTLAQLQIDLLIGVGEHSCAYVDGALSKGLSKEHAVFFKSNEEAIHHLKQIIKDEDVLLIKGSRGMKMEKITDFLQERC